MKIALYILIAFLSFSCAEPKAQLTPEHAVYESVFAFIISDANKPIVISKVTGVDGYIENLDDLKQQLMYNSKERKVRIPSDLLSKFHEINKESKVVDWNPIMVNVEKWFSSKDSQDNSRVSHYQVSKVAVSDNRKRAVVNITHYCYALCGGSYLVYLKKKRNRWVIEASGRIWVS